MPGPALLWGKGSRVDRSCGLDSISGPGTSIKKKKVKHRVTMAFSHFTLRYIYKRMKNVCSHENLDIALHSSSSSKEPKVETTQIPIN